MAYADSFLARFDTPEQVQRYVERFKHGRRRRTDLREKAALAELLASTGKIDVLDLPCGPGRFVPVWTSFANHVILANASPAVVSFVEAHRPPNGKTLETSAESIQLPDECVDLVFSHRFLHHITGTVARFRILREFHRVTRRYLLLPFYPPGLRSRVRNAWQRRIQSSAARDLLDNDRKCKRELEAAGFHLVRRSPLRRIPPCAFLLFEKQTVAQVH
jgi:SAM-dependent methyltransferase